MPNLTSPRRALTVVPMLLAVAALAGCGDNNSSADVPQAGSAEALETEFKDVVSKVSPQVVQIQTSKGLGSGIVYDDRGDVVTNAHVTGSSTSFRVTLADGRRHTGTLVGADAGDDLAVIRIDGGTPAPATFADSSGVESGDIVFAIGNPLGLQSSVTQGIISSVNRNVSEGNGVNLTDVLQTSAEINPGNSGGALVDLSGRVIGIPTLAALDPEFGNTPAPGIGFAIPSSKVQQVADRLISAGR